MMISEYKLNNLINMAVITVRVMLFGAVGGTKLWRARRARSFRGLGAEPPVGSRVKPLVMGEADDNLHLKDTLNNKNCTFLYAINATIGT